jgi:hypothetical protein
MSFCGTLVDGHTKQNRTLHPECLSKRYLDDNLAFLSRMLTMLQLSNCRSTLCTSKISSSSHCLSFHLDWLSGLTSFGSTTVNDVKIENRIGDALVHRIIRAHREGTPWKCCIVIPLLPGFPFPVEVGDASAVNLSDTVAVAKNLITIS